MDIADWRHQIDELDQQLVKLINRRAECALEIGRLKRNSEMPVYEPDRERIIFDNVARNNAGPLSNMQMRQIFERLVDVMRQIQRDEMSGRSGRSETANGIETEGLDAIRRSLSATLGQRWIREHGTVNCFDRGQHMSRFPMRFAIHCTSRSGECEQRKAKRESKNPKKPGATATHDCRDA